MATGSLDKSTSQGLDYTIVPDVPAPLILRQIHIRLLRKRWAGSRRYSPRPDQEVSHSF